jgi:hypothetical protein
MIYGLCLSSYRLQILFRLVTATSWVAYHTAGITETENTVEPGYNDIDLLNTPPIAPDILWHMLIRHC